MKKNPIFLIFSETTSLDLGRFHFQVFNLFFLEPIVEEVVVNYIKAMNPSKSTGRHGIPAKYIKMSGSVIAPVLTNIFNACISTGYFPKVLKTAEVVPIFQKTKENYAVLLPY